MLKECAVLPACVIVDVVITQTRSGRICFLIQETLHKSDKGPAGYLWRAT